MGYTHYWSLNEDFTAEEWDRITEGASKVIEVCSSMLDVHETEVADGAIYLNGIEEDSHETFVFDNNSTDFDFCKTAGKPYDEAVVAILILAKEVAPHKFSWRSDGFNSDHCEGLNLYNCYLNDGYPLEESNVD